jgi:GTP-binding protein EngB required for normal cell division
MHDALVGLLDKVDIAVAESRDVLASSDLAPVARLAEDTRLRLSYPESIVVVALAGGTGSGKSSLFNVLAGEEVALTGGVRPMTVEPLAVIPAGDGESLSGYLDALAIPDRINHDGPSWLCLIDLPDTDSVEIDHRHQVDALLPRVDIVIWVTDPEKYRDAALHQAHISLLAAYQDQFLFVLNQMDRIDPADAAAVVEDLVQALREDGILEPEVITTSAQPMAGPPIGVDRLLQRLALGRDLRKTVHKKLLTDLAAAAAQLVASSSGAHGVEFEKRWGKEVETAVSLVMDGRIADGGHGLAGFVTRLADEVGGGTGDRLHEIADGVPTRFLACAIAATTPAQEEGQRPSTWRDLLLRRGSPPDTDATTGYERLEPEVDRVIGDPIRDLLARRGLAHAAIADLALAVGSLERRTT